MNWKLFDELFASFARPWQIYASCTSAAVSLPLAIYLKSGDLVITALAATVGGLGGYTGYLRTVDLKTKAGTMTTTAQVTTPTVTATMTQGVQPDPAQPSPAPITPTPTTQPHKTMG